MLLTTSRFEYTVDPWYGTPDIYWVDRIVVHYEAWMRLLVYDHGIRYWCASYSQSFTHGSTD